MIEIAKQLVTSVCSTEVSAVFFLPGLQTDEKMHEEHGSEKMEVLS
ncbi:hypothetical protein [Mitsuokella sp.]